MSIPRISWVLTINTSCIVLSLFRTVTHSHNHARRVVPLLLTFTDGKTQAQRSSTTCCGHPASKQFPAGLSDSECLKCYALQPHSSSYLSLSKGCTLTTYFSSCLYWYWNLFTSYIMTKKDYNQYCMYRNLCVMSLHTIRSISRSLIIGPKWNTFKIWTRSVQSLSHVQLFATPWTAARQASLSITNSRSSPKLMSIESVMPSIHLILCRPLLLLPPIPLSIRVFSNESTLLMRWPKYWSFSFSIIPSKEHPGLISFRMYWLDLPAVQGTLKSPRDSQHHSSKASILQRSAFFTVPTFTSIHGHRKNHSLD